MEQLSQVNGCGDKFMDIPQNFLPDLKRATDSVNSNVLFAIGQIVLTLILLISCLIGGRSKHPDDDKPVGYQPLANDEEHQI